MMGGSGKDVLRGIWPTSTSTTGIEPPISVVILRQISVWTKYREISAIQDSIDILDACAFEKHSGGLITFEACKLSKLRLRMRIRHRCNPDNAC